MSFLPHRLVSLFAGLAAALLLAGCDGGLDRTKAQVRLVHAADRAGYAALEMRIDGRSRQTVGYGQTPNYVDVEPDETDTTISAPGSATALLSFTPSLRRDRFYSILTFGGVGTLRYVVLEENIERPASGRVSLRVINAAPDAGPLDVYITADGDSLQSAVPVRAGANYAELSPVLDTAGGTWQLRVTGASDKQDLRLNLAGFVLESRRAMTLVLTPGAGGTMVNALLLVQDGGITVADSTQARVRAVAAVAGSAQVVANVGGVPLLNNAGTPVVVGPYVLVSAGTPPQNVSVNGNSAGPATATLTPGADYTLLVYGPAATPAVALIADDNRLPTVAAKARMRLVNVAAAGAPVMAMTVDALPVAAGVNPGVGSVYEAVNATTLGTVIATAGGAAIYTPAGLPVTSGGVYSVFVTGVGAPATAGAVFRDR
jgi:hypothetical protein